MSRKIQLRRGTSSAWTTAATVLATGEIGLETDTGKFKIGDGATAWASLAYFGSTQYQPLDSDLTAIAALSTTSYGRSLLTTADAAALATASGVTAHLNDTDDAHDASAVSVLDAGGYYTGTNVETVLAELPSRYGPLANYWMPAPTGTDDTAAMDAIIAAAQAASPYRWQIAMRAGTYKRTTPLALTVGYTRLVGAGTEQTILSFSGSSGYAIDVSTATPSFADFTIDGTSATGSAGAFRLNGDIKNVKCEDVAFKNFNTSVAAVSLLGASQNEFDRCFWGGNFRNLALADSGALAPNKNTFSVCNLGNTVGATGAAVTVTNGEANTFDDCLIQSVTNIIAVHITNSAAATGVGARGNRIVGCYFEENGNSQSSSRGIYVQGGSGRSIHDTIIRDNRFFQSAQDNPSRQIELTYTTSTAIDGNYANLGSPHVITYDGGNNVTPLIGDNDFTGIQQIGRGNPTNSLYLTGASANYVAAPDSAALSLSGDCEIVFLIAPNDWTPAAEMQVISKDTAGAGGRSWAVSITTAGAPKFWWSADGTNMLALTSGVAFGFTDGGWGWGRITFDADNGASGRTARFYKQVFASLDEPTEWGTAIDTQTSATATSIADTTTEVEIGAFAGGAAANFTGKIAKLIVRNALSGGTVVAAPDFTAPRGTRHRDSAGNVWTFNGSAWSWSS